MPEFEWDYENLTHIARHGVSPEEVEYALTHTTLDLVLENHAGEDRFSEVGVTREGRFLLVWTTIRGSKVRVVTAYDAPKRLIEAYVESRWRV